MQLSAGTSVVLLPLDERVPLVKYLLEVQCSLAVAPRHCVANCGELVEHGSSARGTPAASKQEVMAGNCWQARVMCDVNP